MKFIESFVFLPFRLYFRCAFVETNNVEETYAGNLQRQILVKQRQMFKESETLRAKGVVILTPLLRRQDVDNTPMDGLCLRGPFYSPPPTTNTTKGPRYSVPSPETTRLWTENVSRPQELLSVIRSRLSQ